MDRFVTGERRWIGTRRLTQLPEERAEPTNLWNAVALGRVLAPAYLGLFILTAHTHSE